MMHYRTNDYQAAPAAVYLNPLEHADKLYIRLWHKPNPFIRKRLQEAPWIQYSKTYKCFVMHHTPHTIGLTEKHFEGLALVNTHYLYRPKRLKPNKQTPVLSGNSRTTPLTKVPVTAVVHLQPVVTGAGTRVSLTYNYNPDIYNCLKKSQVAEWQQELRCFVITSAASDLFKLLAELRGLAQLWLSQELPVKEVALQRALWEQSYAQSPGYISCPLPYLEKLVLLNYSPNTIRTYHSLLLRFLNAHQEQGLAQIQAFTEENINQYHRHLVQAGTYSCSLLNQSINAVKFYYQRVLGRHEVQLNQVERP